MITDIYAAVEQIKYTLRDCSDSRNLFYDCHFDIYTSKLTSIFRLKDTQGIEPLEVCSCIHRDGDIDDICTEIVKVVDCWLDEIRNKPHGNPILKEEKVLGKIDFAEFGTLKDYPFCIGLMLGFKMSCGNVMDGGKYTVNISPECRWEESERSDALVKSLEFVNDILKDAKVNYVSELVNKPVEITLENRTFKSFRILTEVL